MRSNKCLYYVQKNAEDIERSDSERAEHRIKEIVHKHHDEYNQGVLEGGLGCGL